MYSILNTKVTKASSGDIYIYIYLYSLEYIWGDVEKGWGGLGKRGRAKKKKKLHFKDGLFTWRKGAKKGEGPWKVWKE